MFIALTELNSRYASCIKSAFSYDKKNCMWDQFDKHDHGLSFSAVSNSW